MAKTNLPIEQPTTFQYSKKAERYDRLYMDIAFRLSEMSYAKRKKVGALAVRGGQILSEGWNGMPSGMNNVCEHSQYDIQTAETTLTTKKEVLHAESNLLSKIAKSTETTEGATVYCTLAPCIDCAKMLYQAGITRLVYSEDYRNIDGRMFLADADIIVDQLNRN